MHLVENFMRNLFLKKNFPSTVKYKRDICKIVRGPFFMHYRLDIEIRVKHRNKGFKVELRAYG